MLFYLNTITVMYMSSSITGMLHVDNVFYARRSRASHELRRSESKKAKLDRAEQYYKREADWKEAGE